MKNVNKILLLFILVLSILIISCDTADATSDTNRYTADIDTFDGDVSQFRDPDTGIYYLVISSYDNSISVVPKFDLHYKIKLYHD